MTKQIFCWLNEVLFGAYDPDSILSVVGIHATVLSILIGFSTAYVLHVNSQINEVESEALGIAERVNTIKFSRIWLNLVAPAIRFLDEWPSTNQQIPMWLASPMDFSFSSKEWDKVKSNLPFLKILTEKYKLNPTEIYLCMMGASALRYPFPERLIQHTKEKSLRALQPSPVLSFTDIDSLKQWSDDIKNYFLPSMNYNTWFGEEVFTERFDWNNEVNLNKILERPDKKHRTEVLELLKKTPKEYLRYVEKLFNIRALLVPKLKRYDYIKKLMPQKCITYTVFFWAIFAFGSAVIAPLIFQSINKFFIVWVPCAFYLFIIIYSSIKAIKITY